MKLLYVNHTGSTSGAELSLLDLLGGLPKDVDARVACPPGGPLADSLRRARISVYPIPGIDGSLKFHARETPVAIGRLLAAALSTARWARRMDADLIHANSIRAGLVTVAAARAAGIPSIVHLRDRLPRSGVADASLRLLARGAEIVVANSRYTAEGLRAVTKRGVLEVVYNPVDLVRFAPSQSGANHERRALGIPPDAFVVGLIGQITPWKGQHEAIEAVARLRDRGSKAHLLIVGEPKFVSSATRYDNLRYYEELQSLTAIENLGDRVRFCGERQNVSAIISALDAVVVPSWEEPFGRVVVEAMALGLPVLATAVGGPSEIITDGVDGLLLEPRAPAVWAAAIAQLEASPELRRHLGAAAARRARDFALPNHVAAMRELYQRAIGTRRPSKLTRPFVGRR